MFYYKVGEIETNIKWGRPSKRKLLKIWEEFKKVNPYSNDYTFYLTGAVAQGVPTWDTDILILGEENFEKIKLILDDFKTIGFQQGQLIDIKWQSHLFNISGAEFDIVPYYMLRNFNESYREEDGKSKITNWNGTEVYPGLFKTEVETTTEVFEWTKLQYVKKVYRGLNNIKLEKYLYL